MNKQRTFVHVPNYVSKKFEETKLKQTNMKKSYIIATNKKENSIEWFKYQNIIRKSPPGW